LREVRLAAELVTGSTKPSCVFAHSVAAANQVLRVYAVAAGGEPALRDRPMTLGFLDPISPLQLPDDDLEIALTFARAGQPVIVASMAMSTGTAPATLAGTLALVHAEVLAGITALQVLAPGTPVIYGGIPHVLDPRTSQCLFGSPEQSLMAAVMSQLARAFALPIYLNTGLTDALVLDAQAGFEKAASQCLGWLGGADLLGHAGICGADQAGSLEWLVADDAMAGYLRRVRRGFEVHPETLAAEVIRNVGPGGNFLAEPHTVQHFRREFWQPDPTWTRGTWEAWVQGGRATLADRARQRARQLLAGTPPPPLTAGVARVVDAIVHQARHQLAGTTMPS
jgi:trimethylamine--corrinoid protein Co-methyltransferase